MANLLRHIFESHFRPWTVGVRDWLMPAVCLSCRSPVGQKSAVCDACHDALRDLRAVGRCVRCAALLPQGASCGTCNDKGIRPFARIACLCGYDEPTRDLVLATKFGGKWWCGEWLGSELASASPVAEILANAQVIVPVPLHRWRLVWRGFNQSQMIATPLAKYSDATVKNKVIRRVRRTRPQAVLLSRQQRLANVKDAFELMSPKALTGKHVVLVDDIMTTGATLRAVGRVIQRARPASISAIVVCVADRSSAPRVS